MDRTWRPCQSFPAWCESIRAPPTRRTHTRRRTSTPEETRTGGKPKAARAGAPIVEDDPRRVLAQLDVRPRKSMGQHFLVDPRVAARHVDPAHLRPSDLVLEIGPGLAVPTRQLVARAKRVVVLEAARLSSGSMTGRPGSRWQTGRLTVRSWLLYSSTAGRPWRTACG